jgi:hypothetical protein
MKILMTGGTGFVGSNLTRALSEDGHEVTVLTRSAGNRTLPEGAAFLEADPTEAGAWQDQVPRHDAVINLAGASIFQRWTDKAKERMRKSRIRTTRNLVDALADGQERGPSRLLSTSAVGYYGYAGDGIRTEESPPGDDFLAVLSRDWEGEALRARESGAGVVILRFGVVLGEQEGALAKMVPLFKKYLGGPLGSGDQWFSWIHIRDLVEIYRFVMGRPDLEGPLNCTAPRPVRNRELTRALADALGKPAPMPPVPGFVIRAVLGEFGNVLVEGQRVVPDRLSREGFSFRYPGIEGALEDIVGR